MAKISSKKLIERIEHLKEIEYSSNRGYDEKYEKALNDAIDIIHTLNTETAEKKSKKVKHGKWIWDINSKGYYQYCSCCKEKPQSGVITKYCPNCGAKMDLKE